jgi:homospermidine synthase
MRIGTRKLAPYNNATPIPVCAPVPSGLVWALENPDTKDPWQFRNFRVTWQGTVFGLLQNG